VRPGRGPYFFVDAHEATLTAGAARRTGASTRVADEVSTVRAGGRRRR
jgi:hypothetical protein